MPDPNPKIEALRKEGAALRQRLFELEQKLSIARSCRAPAEKAS